MILAYNNTVGQAHGHRVLLAQEKDQLTWMKLGGFLDPAQTVS